MEPNRHACGGPIAQTPNIVKHCEWCDAFTRDPSAPVPDGTNRAANRAANRDAWKRGLPSSPTAAETAELEREDTAHEAARTGEPWPEEWQR